MRIERHVRARLCVVVGTNPGVSTPPSDVTPALRERGKRAGDRQPEGPDQTSCHHCGTVTKVAPARSCLPNMQCSERIGGAQYSAAAAVENVGV